MPPLTTQEAAVAEFTAAARLQSQWFTNISDQTGTDPVVDSRRPAAYLFAPHQPTPLKHCNCPDTHVGASQNGQTGAYQCTR